VQTVRAEETEVAIAFPGGIVVTLALAGKSVDISAAVKGRPALVRSHLDAHPMITVDIVETRGPEE
jgi:hypothetical protein